MISEQCAYHEAGHAVMAHTLGAFVQSINLDPEWDDEALRRDGEVYVAWHGVGFGSAKEKAEALAQLALAGPAAEMLYLGEQLHPGAVLEWSQDWKTACEVTRDIYPNELQQLKWLEEITGACYRYLDTPMVWQATASLSDELVAHEQLEGEEIHEILARWMS